VARRWREITQESVKEQWREQSHAFRSGKIVLQDGLLLQEMGMLLREGSLAADTNGKGNGNSIFIEKLSSRGI
jgi:hypothetical protein